MMGRKYQWMQRWRRVSSSWLANIRWKRLRSSRSQMGQGDPPTFYHHFSDKYGLLEWILVQEILLPIQPLVENGMINEAMLIIFAKMQKEKEFYMCVGRWKAEFLS